MLMGNPAGVILLSILIGWANNLSLISGKAFLLSATQPVNALYASLASGVFFSFFLRKFNLSRRKFSSFSIFGGLIVLGLFSVTILPIFSGTVLAILWFFLATFACAFFRWIGIEIAQRHLDPARAQSYFPHIATADEVGTLIAILILKFYSNWLPPKWTIAAALTLYLLSLAFIALQFLPSRNLEVKFSKKRTRPDSRPPRYFRIFLYSFIAVTFAFGLFKNGEDYLINLVLKDTLSTYHAIQDMMTNYLAISSIFVIGVSYGVGVLTKKRHLSPLWILGVQPILLLAIDIACLLTHNFYMFIAFDVGQSLCITCLYSPAMQMIMGFFPEDYRNQTRSAHNLFFYTLAKIPLVLLFSYTQVLQPELQHQVILLVIFAVLVGCFVSILWLRKSLLKIIFEFISGSEKTASILATQALSFIRPKDFKDRMKDMLSLAPKKILRKTIILGLRFDKSENALDTILAEFQSEKEEIQIAVLDALSVSKHYKAIQFMYNIVIAREKPRSLNVRMNASKILAGMYGRKSIPFLLNGIEDEDPRVVANALETLATFKDKTLISVFKKFLDSTIPRLRANALMGLARIRATREVYRKEVKEILQGTDEKLIASVLYVIGIIKDSRFKAALIDMAESARGKRSPIQSSLAWALSQIKEKKGMEMMDELFSVPYEPEMTRPFLHFFSQMSSEMRFDIIRYLVVQHLYEESYHLNVGNHLRDSHFDFHQEIEYLHLLRKEQGLLTLKVIPFKLKMR